MDIGFANNMPDAAFDETERQFGALLGPGARVRRYTGAHRRRPGYGSIEDLLASRPDAVVVTGAEPASADLRADPCWADFARILDWATEHVGAAWLACLAAHAALAHIDRLERRPLPAKCSGVWPQEVDRTHPLAAGLPDPLVLPHSRLNDVPETDVSSVGYRVVARSQEGGWSVATGRRGHCELVLVQGHPEYTATTLLREYRRDVRRWLKCERDDYPAIPAPYLGAEAAERLGAFRARAEAVERPDARIMEDFPYEAVAAGLTAPWAPAASRLGANWLAGLPHPVAP